MSIAYERIAVLQRVLRRAPEMLYQYIGYSDLQPVEQRLGHYQRLLLVQNKKMSVQQIFNPVISS